MLWLRAAPASYIYVPSPVDSGVTHFRGPEEQMRSVWSIHLHSSKSIRPFPPC